MKSSLLPIALIAGAFVFLGQKKKTKTSTISSPTNKPIIFNCSTIEIKDFTKADQFLSSALDGYLKYVKDPMQISYVSLLGEALKNLNKTCWDKFNLRQMDEEEAILTMYIFNWVREIFLSKYFGEPDHMDQEEEAIWDNFMTNRDPQEISKLKEKLGWNDEWNEQLKTVTDVIDGANKYGI